MAGKRTKKLRKGKKKFRWLTRRRDRKTHKEKEGKFVDVPVCAQCGRDLDRERDFDYWAGDLYCKYHGKNCGVRLVKKWRRRRT